jgi:hypothetical protein
LADLSDLYEKSLDRFGGWVQFEDAKGSLVLVLLGLGLVDLLGVASRAIHAHKLKSGWGDIASGAFWVAIAGAAIAVALVILAIKPRAKASRGSIFFFGTVDTYDSAESYQREVQRLTQEERTAEMASQTWQLAKVTAMKVRLLGWSYWAVTLFLAAWAISRLTLGLAGH